MVHFAGLCRWGPGWPASFSRAEQIGLHFFWDGTDRRALFFWSGTDRHALFLRKTQLQTSLRSICAHLLSQFFYFIRKALRYPEDWAQKQGRRWVQIGRSEVWSWILWKTSTCLYVPLEKKSAPLSVPIEKTVQAYQFRFRKRVHAYLFRSKNRAGLSVPPWKMMQANMDPTYKYTPE